MNQILLEVCIESVDDAATAVAAGADRLELNAALCLAGLTPSLGLLQEVRSRIGSAVPIVAMLRPRGGNFCYSDSEFSTMRRDADLLLANGAGGIAFGILDANRRIDRRRSLLLVQQVLGHPAANEGVVFHRAFDYVADPLAALDTLIALGVRRVLTSGQRPTALQGAEEIARYIQHAGDRIEILPAAGIGPENVRELLLRSGCRQVHGSFREGLPLREITIPNESPLSLGAIEDGPLLATSGRIVAAMVEQLRQLCL